MCIRDSLEKTCADRNYGARPLRRALQKYVEDPLSEALIQGSLPRPSELEVYLGDTGIYYRVTQSETEQLVGLRLQTDVEGVVRTLQSVTRVNAALIGRADLGVVEPGAVADLVVLPGDVFAEPSLLWGEARTVVQGGAVVADD